ncbi:unnamed protein product [Caenorhabditis brenneri]
MPSLLDMTDVPMKNILENCGFKSVLTLRKVCHSLRNFIDDSCFKTDLDNIRITIVGDGFSVDCQSYFCNLSDTWTNRFGYSKDWTSDDLKFILKMAQNSKLSLFFVRAHQDNVGRLEILEELLKNQTRPLQTDRVEMEGTVTLKVLPHLDSNTLKKIYISPINHRDANRNLDEIENVMELEQFKNAVELYIDIWFLVRADLRNFFHFQEIRVRLHETSLDELKALKEAFGTSTHMVYFILLGLNLNGNQLEQVFGTPFHGPRYELDGPQWFFEIHGCKDNVLNIDWNPYRLLFCKLEANEVPQNAVVRH